MAEFDWGSWTNWGSGLSDVASEATQAAPAVEPSFWSSVGDVASSIGRGAESFGKGAEKVLSPLAKIAGGIAPAAQIGLGVGSYLTQQAAQKEAASLSKTAKRAIEQQSAAATKQAAAATPATEFGTRTLERAEAGKIPPEVETQIGNWVQGAKQQARAWAVHAGMGDSQTLMMLEEYIDKQAAGMRADYLMKQEQTGLTALGVGAGAAGGAGATAAGAGGQAQAQAGNLDQLIGQANQSIAALFGGGAR